jgi:anti-sigma factor RsiW
VTADRDHIDESAALYALGVADDELRGRIDRHVAQCDACNELLGAAENDVAAMAAAEPLHQLAAAPVAPRPQRQQQQQQPRRPPTSAWPVWGALAAAVAIAVLPSAYFWRQNQAMHGTILANADAMNRLAVSSFRTAAFNGMNQGASARVMYAPDGSWYVVLVHGAAKPLQVAWMHDGRQTMLGRAEPHGDVAMLYLPKSHRMNQLALVDGERVVAEAQLAY